MAKSTPTDIAVAFRSLDRRRREAVEAADGAAVSGPLGDLDRHIGAAATLLGVAPRRPLPSPTRSTPDPGDEWDEADVDQLRQLATDAGTSLRRVVDAAPPSDDD